MRLHNAFLLTINYLFFTYFRGILKLNYNELNRFLIQNSFSINESSKEILHHFKQKYPAVPYKNELMFIFNDNREFDKKNHLIQLHKRNMGRVPYHIYHYIVMTYAYEGSLTLLVEGTQISLKKGDLIIFDKYVPHSVLRTTQNDLAVNIILAENFFDQAMIKPISSDNILSAFLMELMSHQYKHSHFLQFSTQSIPIISNSFKNILCETFDSMAHSNEIIDYYIMIILNALTRSTSFKTNLDTANLKIQTLIEHVFKYIQAHFTDGNLESMCHELGYNASYISRIIHQYTGKTFKQLVNDQRMNRAKLLLQESGLTISEVAEQVGIHNQTNFYKRFKSLTHLTPKKFRETFTSLK